MKTYKNSLSLYIFIFKIIFITKPFSKKVLTDIKLTNINNLFCVLYATKNKENNYSSI